MKYLNLFESKDNIDHRKILRKILDIVFNNQLISNKIENNFFGLLKYDSDLNKEVLVGAITYHFEENNPFYNNGEFPENRYVIVIEDAEEIFDDNPDEPIIDFDYIRIVPVDNNGNFSVDNLEKYLKQVYNNKR